MTEEAKSIKEYYETHDFSIIKDPATGKLNIRIIEI